MVQEWPGSRAIPAGEGRHSTDSGSTGSIASSSASTPARTSSSVVRTTRSSCGSSRRIAVRQGRRQESRLRIINRAGPKLCLITHEGGQVLAPREPPARQTERRRIELELEEQHAPNFAYAVHVIDLANRKLHSARKEFQVAQPLSVSVVPGSERVLPGGKVAARARGQGQPWPSGGRESSLSPSSIRRRSISGARTSSEALRRVLR